LEISKAIDRILNLRRELEPVASPTSEIHGIMDEISHLQVLDPILLSLLFILDLAV